MDGSCKVLFVSGFQVSNVIGRRIDSSSRILNQCPLSFSLHPSPHLPFPSLVYLSPSRTSPCAVEVRHSGPMYNIDHLPVTNSLYEYKVRKRFFAAFVNSEEITPV